MRVAVLLSLVACGRLEFDPVVGTVDGSPVVVTFGENPDDTFQGGSRDVTLFQGNPTANRGACAVVDADEDVSSANRSLFAFAVSALPGNATILAAELELTVSTSTNAQIAAGQLVFRAVAEGWDEGAECNVAGAASWFERMPGMPWTSTVTSPPTTTDVLVGTVDAPLAVDQVFTMAIDVNTVRAWRDEPGTNFGFALVTSAADSVILVSREGTSGKRPRLRVIYIP